MLYRQRTRQGSCSMPGRRRGRIGWSCKRCGFPLRSVSPGCVGQCGCAISSVSCGVTRRGIPVQLLPVVQLVVMHGSWWPRMAVSAYDAGDHFSSGLARMKAFQFSLRQLDSAFRAQHVAVLSCPLTYRQSRAAKSVPARAVPAAF